MASVTGLVRVESLGGSRFSPYTAMGFASFGDNNAWVIDVGADLRARGRLDLRVDVRNYIRPARWGTIRYWSVRAGAVFRLTTP